MVVDSVSAMLASDYPPISRDWSGVRTDRANRSSEPIEAESERPLWDQRKFYVKNWFEFFINLTSLFLLLPSSPFPSSHLTALFATLQASGSDTVLQAVRMNAQSEPQSILSQLIYS